MKKLILTAAACMVAVSAFAQGQFLFTNRDSAAGVDARFFVEGETTASSVGAGYVINLFGGPANGTLAALSPATASFRSTPAAGVGYINPITVTVPTVAPGAAADIRVEVMSPGGAAVFNRTYSGFSLGGDTITPPTLPMGNTPITIVPEPATLALAGLGLGALLLIRRRK